MVDRIGTLFGFLVGTALILFGITWPDHLSNYYVYKITSNEHQVTEMRAKGAPRAQIEAKQRELAQFKLSWEAGITRFLDLKSIAIVLGGAYAATMIAFPFRRALKSLLYVFLVFEREKSEEEFETVYKYMTEFSELRYQDEIIPDGRVSSIPLYFMRDAIENFIQVDWVSEEMMIEIISSEIDNYAYQEDQDILVLSYMGKAAPAFGLLGTVLGAGFAVRLLRALGHSSSI